MREREPVPVPVGDRDAVIDCDGVIEDVLLRLGVPEPVGDLERVAVIEPVIVVEAVLEGVVV